MAKKRLATDESAQRIARAIESLSLSGAGSQSALDAACQAVIDGSNTTHVLKAWWPRAVAIAGADADRYVLLSHFAEVIAEAWKDKTYTLRSYTAEASGETAMTPLDDLAGYTEGGQLATDGDVESVDDWTKEDPMTWYIRANALSLSDGTMNITAIEGLDNDFDLSGESAPVYTFALALWIYERTEGSYDYISYRTTQDTAKKFYPDAADVDPNNNKRALTWHPTFPGGLNSKGALTSGAGLPACNFTSAASALPLARKIDAYEGLWNDCDTRWLLRMWQLRHWNLENSDIASGCLNYNYQYPLAAAETGVKRVLVTTSQGANFLVGSTVSVGERGSNTNNDRWNGYMRNIADKVRITSIENVTVDGSTYTALNLDLPNTINTTKTCYVSTMPWHSGATEALPGHADGCIAGLTSGKGPLRVAGVEVLDGAYTIGLDPLYQVTAGSASGKFTYKVFECRDSEKLAGSITSDYKDTGISYADYPQGWQYVKAFVKTKLGVLFPRLINGGSTTYYKSAFSGTYSAGARCPWRFLGLSGGVGGGGLAGGVGGHGPSYSSWDGRPRLSGSGKKRGEWQA